MAVDSSRNLYIADTYNNRIRKVDTSGNISTVAGSLSTDGYSGDGGLAVNAQLNEPEGVTVDGNGNLYIADTDNNRIRKVIPNGNIMTIAGTGRGDYSGDGGPGILAEINGPTGLAMDSNGSLYIADKYNYAIRKQVTYIPSSDASLSNITLSSGTLSPEFAPSTTTYSASVVNGVSSIRVTPTTSDSFITVKVNGESVASGAQSGDITLDVGDNAITLVALAEDGETTKTYTITIKRLRSSNANLSQLTLSNGMLSPAFASNTTSYTANASQSAITVTSTMADPMATVKVNGTTVENGTESQSIPLAVGSTPIAVMVTAQDGTTTKTYTITVTRTISANADLSSLELSSGTLSPSFIAGTLSYTATVGNSVSGMTVTPTVADGSATVSVNDVPVASGAASASLPLVVGSNTITVKVTAENGTLKTYTVTVIRAASSNADLSDLVLSSGNLTPSFLPGTYKASVGNSVNSVTITSTVSDQVHATVMVSLFNGNGTLVSGPMLVASGAASPDLELGVGNNTITLLVTAEDGTTKTYTVTVTRGASSNAELSNLVLSSGTLTPAFGGTYTASVGNSVSSITVTATLSDAVNASVTASVYDDSGPLVSGPHILTSGEASSSLPLNVGNNVVSVLVTAQDGSIRTYTVTVTRAAASANADLNGLGLSNGMLSPLFRAGTTSYTASVDNSVSDIMVTPTAADGCATVSVNDMLVASGVASVALPLVVGSNTITVKVTAENGTTKIYTITVTRENSGSAALNGLILSSGTLSPAFEPVTTNYMSSVDNSVNSVTVTMKVYDADKTAMTASVYNIGGTLISGPFAMSTGTAAFSLPLVMGSNEVMIIVGTQDGMTKTYRVNITRAAASAGGGGGGGGTGGSAPVANELVNDKPHIDLNGQEMDPADIDTRLSFVTLEAAPKDGVVSVSIPAKVLTDLASSNADFYLEIETPYGSYHVPVDLAHLIPELPDWLAKNNLQTGDISFKITLTNKSGDQALQAVLATDLPKGNVMGAIVDYSMEIVNTKTGQSIGSVDSFSKVITRVIPMPMNLAAMPEQWGAFRYNETMKQLEFVPARSIRIDGAWYVIISSYTNSVYMVAENPLSFNDMLKHWAKTLVDLAAAKGLVEGGGDGTFAPDRTVTRAEFTAMLVRSLGRSASFRDRTAYDDVAPDAWYSEAVATAKELGLLEFASGDSFKPNQPLTRVEMASMLSAVIALQDSSMTKGTASLAGYMDIGSVNGSYLENIRLMVKLQIMVGTSEETFSPKGVSTRAQAAAVLIRTLQQLGLIDQGS